MFDSAGFVFTDVFLSPHRKALQLNWTGTAESTLFPQANFPGMRFSPLTAARLLKKPAEEVATNVVLQLVRGASASACTLVLGCQHCFAEACSSCLRGSCVVFKSGHTSRTHAHWGWAGLVGSRP